MQELTQLNILQIPLSTAFSLVFYLVIGAYAIFSAVFYYHWTAYGTNMKATLITFTVYFFTTIPLFVVMGILAFNM